MSPIEYKKSMIAAAMYRKVCAENRRLKAELAARDRIDMRISQEDAEAFRLVRNRTPDWVFASVIIPAAQKPEYYPEIVEDDDDLPNMIGLSVEDQRRISEAAMLVTIGLSLAILAVSFFYWKGWFGC